MRINGKKYRFNGRRLLKNMSKLATFILLELSFAYMFTNMLIAVIEKYN